jgi:hypothetical protein
MNANDYSAKGIVAVIDDDIDITTLFHDILRKNVLEASVYANANDSGSIEALCGKPIKLCA